MAKEILIADADKADQEEFQKIFGTAGYHLIFSESGEDALLRAKRFKPDMIIASGAGLHEMGGLELCGVIKGDPKFKNVPFILISSIFDEISEKDRKRFQADGVISRPLNENEVLDLVDNLVEEEAVGKRKKMVSEKGDFLLGEMGDGEDEIIELMDVVDEPEPKMSIDSFIPSEKEKSFEEGTSLESWDKLEFEEKAEEGKIVTRPGREARDIGLQIRKQKSFDRTSSESELFEKIELEEILEKVEELKPTLEKEWPSEKEVRYAEEKPPKAEKSFEKYLIEKEWPSENEVRYVEEKPPKTEESLEKYLNISEFEATPQEEVKIELPEEKFTPLSIKIPKKEVSEKAVRMEESVEEEELQPFFVEEPKEEISEETVPVEEFMEKEEIRELPKDFSKELSTGKVIKEEELEELLEEEFPEELFEEMLEEEQIDTIDSIGRTEEAQVEEVKIEEIQPEAIRMETPEEFKTPRTYQEEIRPLVSEMMKQIQEASPLARKLDKDLEEIIAKGIQDKVGDFITKILPLMTQHIIGLTKERVEKMVKEIVPDLAEKAIQEEIKRLQKGEKE